MEVSTTLDHVRKFSVPGNPFLKPANEYYAIVCLFQGMSFLNAQVKQAEQVICDKMGDDNTSIFVYNLANEDFAKDFPDVHVPLLTMAFQWYSVSACQYVRAIANMMLHPDWTKNEIAEFRRNYDNEVIPEVVPYRDKVGSKLAVMTKNNKDNTAERLISLIPQLSFCRGRIKVGAMTAKITRGGKTTDSSSISAWSLTEVHERLRDRYWRPHESVTSDS